MSDLGQSEGRTWPIGMRLFDRLRPSVHPGDVVTLSNGQPARVDTAKLANDLKDAKSTVEIVCPKCGSVG